MKQDEKKTPNQEVEEAKTADQKTAKEHFHDQGNGTAIRSRTANWFECKIRYEKVMEDGIQKKVCEWYAVDALSFGEAEARIIDEMASFISGEFDVNDIKKAKYHEIFFSPDPNADKWYRAKLAFLTIDEKTEKEKRSYVIYLVQASSFEDAQRNVNKVMGVTLFDYEIKSIDETQIWDVFEYKKKETEEKDTEE